MYVVIFKAEMNELDSEYSEMAERMRDLAINEYGALSLYEKGNQYNFIRLYRSLHFGDTVCSFDG